MGHEHEHDNDRDRDDDRPAGGGPDTQFLDLELSKVLYAEAEGVTRDAFRELLKEAAKRRLRDRWGARIDALAALAVDELIADADANLAIEAQIASRNQARRAVDERVAELLARAPDAVPEDDDGPDA